METFFYNPNIHPQEEFYKRKDAFIDFAGAKSVKAHIPEYNAQDYDSNVLDVKGPNRCLECWQLRLERAAEFAVKNGFSCFSTALLASPYQNIEAINMIGRKAALKHNSGFLFRDFRLGFIEAHNKAKADGIYCQKYCGCRYSLEERKSKKKCRA